MMNSFQEAILRGIPQELPPAKDLDHSVSHAPRRVIKHLLSPEEKKLAIRNALRYFDKKFHTQLAVEFAEELDKYGRIYMYRFRPVLGPVLENSSVARR